jgi:hypothetical protein
MPRMFSLLLSTLDPRDGAHLVGMAHYMSHGYFRASYTIFSESCIVNGDFTERIVRNEYSDSQPLARNLLDGVFRRVHRP